MTDVFDPARDKPRRDLPPDLAAPEEVAARFLLRLEQSPRCLPDWPHGETARPNLDGIDLSGPSIEARCRNAAEVPCWWDPERRSLRLRGVDFRGMSLQGAVLRGVDLTAADFRDANLERADLRGACLRDAQLQGCRLRKADLEGAELAGCTLEGASLEEAGLKGVDLAGVNLAAAKLGEADLRGAMLEDTNLRGASLRFARLQKAVLEKADLRGADLWGADLEGAHIENADLRNARLEEVILCGASLARADLRDSILRKVDARGADLSGADLRGANASGANLRDAVLKEARLQEVALADCDITHVKLAGAKLDDTSMRLSQLGGAIGEELNGEFEPAAQGYQALERNFTEMGDHDAASWAYRRRRRMQKRDLLIQASRAWSQSRRGAAIVLWGRYAGDQGAEWVCDYGESVPRVLAAIFVLYITFTILYGLTGSVVREAETPSGAAREVTRNPIDLAIFSLLAMTTGTVGVELLPRDRLALTLIGIHVFLGIAMTGLLGFVLGNRIRR